MGPVDLATLPISRDLRMRLLAWDQFADETLSANDHEWPSARVAAEFEATGPALADELRRELGIEVIYMPDGDVDTPAERQEPLADQGWTAYAPLSGETYRPRRRRTST